MSTTTITPSPSSLRVQRIKDISLYKDILRDITAAEFALQIEAKQKSREKIIDFDKLIVKLTEALVQIEKRQQLLISCDDTASLLDRINSLKEDLIVASNSLPLKYTGGNHCATDFHLSINLS